MDGGKQVLTVNTHEAPNENIAGKRMRQGAFLSAYARLARINRAAEAAGIDRQTHYDWLKNDEFYAVEFINARNLAVQQLEDEAIRRAHEGVEEPINVGGEKVMVRKFSDQLMMFILKGMRPDVYRDRSSIEHSGPGGAAIAITMLDKIISDADGANEV